MKFLLLAAACNTVANLLLKVASNADGARASFLHPAFIAGAGCFGLGLLAFLQALKSVQLSIAYPLMSSISFVLVIACSILLFREHLSPLQLAGVGMIIAGIFLVHSA